jgi:tetratricopeptide (TPR) repeat protein
MRHAAIDQVLHRADRAKEDSDFTYFFSLLLAAEALVKTTVLGLLACILEDKDRHRYRLEYALAHADGLGDWTRALDDALTGPASQFLLADLYPEQTELIQLHKEGAWQHDAVAEMKAALDHLRIDAEPLPTKSDLRRWFRLFVVLRNGTRAHGATPPEKTQQACLHLRRSIDIFYNNHALFARPWAYLYRNLSGKYRVSAITANVSPFDSLKKESDKALANGIYIFAGIPRVVPLLLSGVELDDFLFPNGAFTGRKYELLSYATDNKSNGDASAYNVPPGTLPSSETEGSAELQARGNCFSNAPDMKGDYVPRSNLENQLTRLLQDDQHAIVTLLGKGGIGKTSLAVKAISQLYATQRFAAIVWFSARDVDLQASGPKAVRPLVLSPDDFSSYYASLVLSKEEVASKSFNARRYFEDQMHTSNLGPCLYVFDNFETTQNPVEVFNWIDTYLRSPNKVLITTRLRDFRGDYPVDVRGMEEPEARRLIEQTAVHLGVSDLLTPSYIDELISESEGHPYVIKILLGDVAKAGRLESIRKIVSSSDEILTALFERTYAALSPCSQRAFLTLSAWNSSVPRVALEAVLQRSTGERAEVERGIDSLLQFSMAERDLATDQQEFVGLPLVSSVFGKKKLKVSQYKASVEADVQILQMLGATRVGDIHMALAVRLENFVKNVARRVDAGESPDKYAAILEMMCRAYYPGWLSLARWYMEQDDRNGYTRAREALERYLENDSASQQAEAAWAMLARACYKLGDLFGEIHAFIERVQIDSVPFSEVSTTANRLNGLLRDRARDWDANDKQQLIRRVVDVMDRRIAEADSDDLSRMAWLAVHLHEEDRARRYVRRALELNPDNPHCIKLTGFLRVSPHER